MDPREKAERFLDTYNLPPEIAGTMKAELKRLKASDSTGLGFNMNLNYKKLNSKPALTLNDSTLIFIGEIFTLVALPGSGKSQTMEILCAAFLAKRNGLEIDTIGFEDFLPVDKEVLFIDYERPHDVNRDGYQRIYDRLNSPIILDGSGELKGLTYKCFVETPGEEARRKQFEAIVKTGQYGLVLIDGILGISTLNDEKEASFVVQWLISLASKYQFAIVITMHPNKGSETMAGHIGAYLYRYSRACLLLKSNENDRNVKELTNQFAQGKASYAGGDITAFMRYDEEKRMFVSESNAPAAASLISPGVLKLVFEEFALEGIIKVPSSLFKDRYSRRIGKSTHTAKNHVTTACKMGIIRSDGIGKGATYSWIEPSG